MSESLTSPRFGEIHYSREDVLSFPAGLPGFVDLKQFLLIDSPDLQPFKFLQSVEEGRIFFPLLDPKHLDPNFRYRLNRAEKELLQLEDSDRRLVFCFVTLAARPEESTANLFAPVVINASKMVGTQIILFESDYQVDRPLMSAGEGSK